MSTTENPTTFKFRSRFPSPNICIQGRAGCQFADHLFFTEDAALAQLLRASKVCGRDLEFWEETPAIRDEIAKAAADGGGLDNPKDTGSGKTEAVRTEAGEGEDAKNKKKTK